MTLGIAILFFEEGHEAARGFLGIPSLAWQILNLGLFLGLLWYFLRKPAADFFGNRKADVAKALAKADEDRRRAEQLSEELKARLASIETELGTSGRPRGATRKPSTPRSSKRAGRTPIRSWRRRAPISTTASGRRGPSSRTSPATSRSTSPASFSRRTSRAEDEKRLLEEGIAHLTGAAQGRGGTR